MPNMASTTYCFCYLNIAGEINRAGLTTRQTRQIAMGLQGKGGLQRSNIRKERLQKFRRSG
jgi:hypothetical protein